MHPNLPSPNRERSQETAILIGVGILTLIIMIVWAVTLLSWAKDDSHNGSASRQPVSIASEDNEGPVASEEPSDTTSTGQERDEPSGGHTSSAPLSPLSSPSSSPSPSAEETAMPSELGGAGDQDTERTEGESDMWTPSPQESTINENPEFQDNRSQQEPSRIPEPSADAGPNCPSGTVDFSLTSVEITEIEVLLNGISVRPDLYTKASGMIRNNSTAAVDVSLESEVVVIEVDNEGREQSALYAEIEYTPAPGVKRPSEISLLPGEEVRFTATDERLTSAGTGLWILDQERTGYLLPYSDRTDDRCFQDPDTYVDTSAMSATFG